MPPDDASVVDAFDERLQGLANEVESGNLLRATGQLNGRLDGVGLTAITVITLVAQASEECEQNEYHKAISAAVGTFEKLQKPDGRFSDDLISHSVACLAMYVAGHHKSTTGHVRTRADTLVKGLTFLKRQQATGGGFPTQAGGQEADPLSSHFAAETLRGCYVPFSDAGSRWDQKLLAYFSKLVDARSGQVLGAGGKPDRMLTAATAAGMCTLRVPSNDPRYEGLIKGLLSEVPTHEKPELAYWMIARSALSGVSPDKSGDWIAAWNKAVSRYYYVRADLPRDKPPDDLKGRVSKIVEAMRSADFQAREIASREAAKLPTPAAEFLASYRNDRDPEVASRAKAAIVQVCLRQADDPLYMSLLVGELRRIRAEDKRKAEEAGE